MYSNARILIFGRFSPFSAIIAPAITTKCPCRKDKSPSITQNHDLALAPICFDFLFVRTLRKKTRCSSLVIQECGDQIRMIFFAQDFWQNHKIQTWFDYSYRIQTKCSSTAVAAFHFVASLRVTAVFVIPEAERV